MISPLENIKLFEHSGASGSTFNLFEEQDKKFLRKSTTLTPDKLEAQFLWLKKNPSASHPKLYKSLKTTNYFSYDIEYLDQAITLSSYLNASDQGYLKIEDVFNYIEERFSSSVSFVQKNDYQQYLEEKIIGKIKESCRLSPAVNDLSGRDKIEINGVVYPGIAAIIDRIREISWCGEGKGNIVHGDLTAENILIDQQLDKLFFIDPNPEFLLPTKGLEYTKILQSILGDYEFTDAASLFKHQHSFEVHYESQYSENVKNYALERIFQQLGLPAEVISFYLFSHYTRLLPYKARKNADHSLCYLLKGIELFWKVIEE